jgi:hypothetical protein
MANSFISISKQISPQESKNDLINEEESSNNNNKSNKKQRQYY